VRYCDCHVGFVHDLRGHRARQGYKARFAELLQINRRSKRLAKAANRRKIIFEDWDKDFFVISVGKKVRTKRGLEGKVVSVDLNTANPKCVVEVLQDDTDHVHGRRLVLSVKDEQTALDWCW
jgi:hypothetical protein